MSWSAAIVRESIKEDTHYFVRLDHQNRKIRCHLSHGAELLTHTHLRTGEHVHRIGEEKHVFEVVQKSHDWGKVRVYGLKKVV